MSGTGLLKLDDSEVWFIATSKRPGVAIGPIFVEDLDEFKRRGDLKFDDYVGAPQLRDEWVKADDVLGLFTPGGRLNPEYFLDDYPNWRMKDPNAPEGVTGLLDPEDILDAVSMGQIGKDDWLGICEHVVYVPKDTNWVRVGQVVELSQRLYEKRRSEADHLLYEASTPEYMAKYAMFKRENIPFADEPKKESGGRQAEEGFRGKAKSDESKGGSWDNGNRSGFEGGFGGGGSGTRENRGSDKQSRDPLKFSEMVDEVDGAEADSRTEAFAKRRRRMGRRMHGGGIDIANGTPVKRTRFLSFAIPYAVVIAFLPFVTSGGRPDNGDMGGAGLDFASWFFTIAYFWMVAQGMRIYLNFFRIFAAANMKGKSVAPAWLLTFLLLVPFIQLYPLFMAHWWYGNLYDEACDCYGCDGSEPGIWKIVHRIDFFAFALSYFVFGFFILVVTVPLTFYNMCKVNNHFSETFFASARK